MNNTLKRKYSIWLDVINYIVIDIECCTNNFENILKIYRNNNYRNNQEFREIYPFLKHYYDIGINYSAIRLCNLFTVNKNSELYDSKNEHYNLHRFLNKMKDLSKDDLNQLYENKKTENDLSILKRSLEQVSIKLLDEISEKSDLIKKIKDNRNEHYAHLDENIKNYDREKIIEIKDLTKLAKKVYFDITEKINIQNMYFDYYIKCSINNLTSFIPQIK